MEDALISLSFPVHKAVSEEGKEGEEKVVVDADICELLAKLDIEPGKAPTPGNIVATTKWTRMLQRTKIM